MIKKEINTFFQTPVFIINAGFALALFILMTIIITFKFDSFILFITDTEAGMGLNEELILNNLSIIILMLIMVTSYMTSITNSVISLEGKNLSILKSLPVNTKTILLAKVYSSLLITTPALVVGDIILFLKFKTNIIEALLLLILSVLIPLVSHFIGILVNLKYPKLDFENSTEVVKQSMSSFLSVMIGMVLLVLNIAIIIKVMGKISSFLILILVIVVYIVINLILYLLLIKKGVKKFEKLTI